MLIVRSPSSVTIQRKASEQYFLQGAVYYAEKSGPKFSLFL